MEDVDEVIAKVEQYAQIIAARNATSEAISSEGLALMQQTMQQTMGMVARIRKEVDETLETGARERKSYYVAQYHEQVSSVERFESAMTRRRDALRELRNVLEGRNT